MTLRRKKTRLKEIDVDSIVNKPGVDDHLFSNDTGQRATISLKEIKEREIDTRAISDEHVASLSESIAALGLIEPIVIDRTGRLLAGAHRLASVRLLKTDNSPAYNKHFPDDAIPVRIMPFDADEKPNKALECEVAENEHRRDYTAKEVRELAERLKSAGYLATRGRPQKGEKPLVPALQVIVGKSRRTLTRYLAENENEKNEPNGSFIKRQQTLKKLQRDLNSVVKLQLEEVENSRIQAFNKQLPKFMKLLEAALKEIEVERNS